MSEVWKDIPGYESLYQVSDMGRVKSLSKEIWNGKSYFTSQEKLLKLSKGSNERLYVCLYKNKKMKRYSTYHLVALTFIGERPKGYIVAHKDGDIYNNKLSNLRYDTRSQNEIDCYRYNSKKANGKLSVEQVLEIRQLYKSGSYSYRQLGKIFNVSNVQIGRIINKISYSYINDDGTIQESNTAVS